jgi:glycosyltransferase involved in cell wall biosynthesis
VNIVICPFSPALFREPALHRAVTTHTIGLANALAAIPGLAVRVLYPKLADLSLFSGRVQIVPLDIPRILQQWSNAPSWALSWNLFVLSNVYRLRHQRPLDVVYLRFSPSFIGPSLLVKVLLRSSLVVFEINTPAMVSTVNRGVMLHWFSIAVDRLALAACHAAFVVSEELRTIMVQQHGRWAETKLFVNMNGVDQDRFRPIHNSQAIDAYRESLGFAGDEFVVGYAGRALPHHRLDVLAKVLGEVSDPPLRLVVAGDIGSFSDYEGEKLGSGRVFLLGRIPHEHVPLFLNACDILVLPHGPSYRGMLHQSPIKLFEYMAVGKPVVASQIGQIERVITHNENGLLFDWDDDAQLKECIVRLTKDSQLRMRLGRAARDTVINNYTWDHNASRVLALVRELRSD